MKRYLDLIFPFNSKRDVLLDVCKGIAILLVVLGHIFQGAYSNFDDFLGFTFIYSFHMPLFTLLAGASAAFWIGRVDFQDDCKSFIRSLLIRINKAFIHLIIPFVFWALFSYFYSHRNKEFLSYIWRILKQPDYGLWFLPLIFWCVVFTCAFLFAIFIFYRFLKHLPRLEKHSDWLLSLNLQVLFMYLAWSLLKYFMPTQVGLSFANHFHGGLFFYFLVGVVSYRSFVETKSFLVRTIPYVVFLALVSYWDRLGAYNISPDAELLLSQQWFVKHYALVVALSGSLVFIDLSRLIVSLNIGIITRTISILGISSLAIYALHTYLLGLKPVLIAPLLISVIVFRISGFIPPLRKMMFG